MTTPIPREERAAMRERCDEATPGPWAANEDENYKPPVDLKDFGVEQRRFCIDHEPLGPLVTTPPYRSYSCRPVGDIYCSNSANNAAFIAHSRTDMPALLDEVERLRGEIDWALQSTWMNPAIEAILKAALTAK